MRASLWSAAEYDLKQVARVVGHMSAFYVRCGSIKVQGLAPMLAKLQKATMHALGQAFAFAWLDL